MPTTAGNVTSMHLVTHMSAWSISFCAVSKLFLALFSLAM